MRVRVSVLCLALALQLGWAESQGGEGEACYPNGTCDKGLVCLSNRCVNPGTGQLDGSVPRDLSQACFSLKFSGNDKVIIPIVPDLRVGPPMSIVAWVKVTGNPRYAVILHQGLSGLACGPYNLTPNPNSFMGLEIRGGQGSLKCQPEANGYASSATPLNRWFHLAATYDGAHIKIYLDGKQDSSTKVSAVKPYTAQHAIWLGKNDGPHNGLTGNLHGVQVWGRPVTAGEVAQSFAGTLKNTVGLMGWWPMNEGSGTTAYDHSGTKSHGKIVGAVWDNSCP